MTLKTLQTAKIEAMKNKNNARKDTIAVIIDTIQKASITPKGRIEITEQLVDEVLIKYQKMTQELIDTCPADRTDLLDKYNAEMSIIKEFVPQLITDTIVIKERINTLVESAGLALEKKNKGPIMKLVSTEFKGKADMKIVSQVVAGILV